MTAPSDEAFIYDLELARALGMNTLRKHVKIEPARFYYHADRLGVMVWQDMPSGGSRLAPPEHARHLLNFQLLFGVSESLRNHVDDNFEGWGRDAESRAIFETEWKEAIDSLRFFPSVVMWVPFNEYWGQFDTARISDWTKQYDPTRLVNNASGWVDQGVADVYDQHVYSVAYERVDHYHDPLGAHRVGVMGEFGGMTLAVDGHIWNYTSDTFGYGAVENSDRLWQEYADILHRYVIGNLDNGLSSAIYTQVSDIEQEINGLVTYDRKVEKLDRQRAKALHQELMQAFDERYGTEGKGDLSKQ